MRFSIETWAPEYGAAADAELLEQGGETVEVDIEHAAADWSPIVPAVGDAPERIVFVDGVRRIDARIWIHAGDRVRAGVCASVAAGMVICDRAGARVESPLVRRGVFAAADSGASAIDTALANYDFVPTVGDDAESVYLAIHELMTGLEVEIASRCSGDLVVFDGPLRGRRDPVGVGYVKTQHVQYLPDDLMPVIGRLDDGERTPLFLVGGRGVTRYSWYLRLPGPRSQPLSGVVRCELPAVGAVADAAVRADLVSRTLPRFASEPHKDPRAPQNLYPIAGLEFALRRRLGDALLLERTLRRAAATVTEVTG